MTDQAGSGTPAPTRELRTRSPSRTGDTAANYLKLFTWPRSVQPGAINDNTSPLAYVHELFNLATSLEAHADPLLAQPLKTRRADIGSLAMDERSLKETFPTLTLVIDRLEDAIRKSDDTLPGASLREILAEASMPINLPFHFAWEQVRAVLKQRKLSVWDVVRKSDPDYPNFCFGNVTSHSLRAAMALSSGFSPQVRALLTAPASAEGETARNLVGEPSTQAESGSAPPAPLDRLRRADALRRRLGMSRKQLRQMLGVYQPAKQHAGDATDRQSAAVYSAYVKKGSAAIAPATFINDAGPALYLRYQDNDENKPVLIEGLTNAHLDRILRLLRLHHATGLSFPDIDTIAVTAMRAEGQKDHLLLTETTLRAFGLFQHLRETYRATPSQFATLIGHMPWVANGREKPFYDSLFNPSGTNPHGDADAVFKVDDLPFVTPENPDSDAIAIRQLAKAMEADEATIRWALERIAEVQAPKAGSLTRSIAVVSACYRLIALPRLFGLKPVEAPIVLTAINRENPAVFLQLAGIPSLNPTAHNSGTTARNDDEDGQEFDDFFFEYLNRVDENDDETTARSQADILDVIALVMNAAEWLKRHKRSVAGVCLPLLTPAPTQPAQEWIDAVANAAAQHMLPDNERPTDEDIARSAIQHGLGLKDPALAIPLLKWTNRTSAGFLAALLSRESSLTDVTTNAATVSLSPDELTAWNDLERHAAFARQFGLSALALATMVDHPGWFNLAGDDGTNLRMLDLTTAYQLSRYSDWVARLVQPHGEVEAIQYLREVHENRSLTSKQAADMLQRLTGWSLGNIEAIATTIESKTVASTVEDLRDIDLAMRLNDLADASGLSIHALRDINALKFTSAYPSFQKAAASLLAACSRQDAVEIEGRHGERWRDALVSWMLEKGIPTASVPAQSTDADALSDYLLMDVNVGREPVTSRVASAVESLQTYIHRIFSGLEPGHAQNEAITPDTLKTWKSAQSQYGRWLLLRRLKNYPENRIDPTRRPRATKAYRELQNLIAQGKFSDADIEAAILAFMSSIEATSNIQPLAAYHDGVDPLQDTYHFIGKSNVAPAQYYWRTLDMKLRDADGLPSALAFTEWEAVSIPLTGAMATTPLPPKGVWNAPDTPTSTASAVKEDARESVDTIRPVVIDGRRCVVWVERDTTGLPMGKDQKVSPYVALRVCYCYRQLDELWSPANVLMTLDGRDNNGNFKGGVPATDATSFPVVVHHSATGNRYLKTQTFAPGLVVMVNANGHRKDDPWLTVLLFKANDWWTATKDTPAWSRNDDYFMTSRDMLLLEEKQLDGAIETALVADWAQLYRDPRVIQHQYVGKAMELAQENAAQAKYAIVSREAAKAEGVRSTSDVDELGTGILEAVLPEGADVIDITAGFDGVWDHTNGDGTATVTRFEGTIAIPTYGRWMSIVVTRASGNRLRITLAPKDAEAPPPLNPTFVATMKVDNASGGTDFPPFKVETGFEGTTALTPGDYDLTHADLQSMEVELLRTNVKKVPTTRGVTGTGQIIESPMPLTTFSGRLTPIGGTLEGDFTLPLSGRAYHVRVTPLPGSKSRFSFTPTNAETSNKDGESLSAHFFQGKDTDSLLLLIDSRETGNCVDLGASETSIDVDDSMSASTYWIGIYADEDSEIFEVTLPARTAGTEGSRSGRAPAFGKARLVLTGGMDQASTDKASRKVITLSSEDREVIERLDLSALTAFSTSKPKDFAAFRNRLASVPEPGKHVLYEEPEVYKFYRSAWDELFGGSQETVTLRSADNSAEAVLRRRKAHEATFMTAGSLTVPPDVDVRKVIDLKHDFPDTFCRFMASTMVEDSILAEELVTLDGSNMTHAISVRYPVNQDVHDYAFELTVYAEGDTRILGKLTRSYKLKDREAERRSSRNKPNVDDAVASTRLVRNAFQVHYLDVTEVNNKARAGTAKIPVNAVRLNTLLGMRFSALAAQSCRKLIDWNTQNLREPRMEPGAKADRLDFRGANSLYFWELFFHVPMLMAWHLCGTRQYDAAFDWCTRHLFDPYDAEGDRQAFRPPFWRNRPLAEQRAVLAGDSKALTEDVDELAYADPKTYAKATFLMLVDLWRLQGDDFYRQLTRDDIGEAANCYRKALALIGPLPEQLTVPAPALPALEEVVDSDFLPPVNLALTEARSLLQSRLFNIRHGLTIDGKVMDLQLYADEDDFDSLGNSRTGLLSGSGRLPRITVLPYRFKHVLPAAKEAVAQLIDMGRQVFHNYEQQYDAGLSVKQQANLIKLSKFTLDLEMHGLAAARAGRDTLLANKRMIEKRRDYYKGLDEAGHSKNEMAATGLASAVTGLRVAAIPVKGAAAALEVLPTVFGLANGGFRNWAIARSIATQLDIVSDTLAFTADELRWQAAFDRDRAGWKHEAEQASAELEIVDRQLFEQDIQITAAKTAVDSEQARQAVMKDEYIFMTTGFAIGPTYDWMIRRLSDLYAAAYDAVVSLCFAAENSWRYETGDFKASFIARGAWLDDWRGMLAGDALQRDLARMETAYAERHERRMHIRKVVSLKSIGDTPQADDLKSAFGLGDGEDGMNFSLKPELYDGDFPGQYLRQIISISVVCKMKSAGARSFSAILEQTSNRILIEDDIAGAMYMRDPTKGSDANVHDDLRSQQQTAITTLTPIVDMDGYSALFSLVFSDGRYLPFEGTGAISDWRLWFPMGWPEGLEDIVLTIDYTAAGVSEDRMANFSSALASDLSSSSLPPLSEDTSAGSAPRSTPASEPGSGSTPAAAPAPAPARDGAPPSIIVYRQADGRRNLKMRTPPQASWVQGMTFTTNWIDPVTDKTVFGHPQTSLQKAGGETTFRADKFALLKAMPGKAQLFYTIHTGGSKTRSDVLNIKLVDPNELVLPTPRVEEVVANHALDRRDVPNGATLVIAAWPFMQEGQAVWVSCEGIKADGHSTGPLDLRLPSEPITAAEAEGDLRLVIPYGFLDGIGDFGSLKIVANVSLDGKTDKKTADAFPELVLSIPRCADMTMTDSKFDVRFDWTSAAGLSADGPQYGFVSPDPARGPSELTLNGSGKPYLVAVQKAKASPCNMALTVDRRFLPGTNWHFPADSHRSVPGMEAKFPLHLWVAFDPTKNPDLAPGRYTGTMVLHLMRWADARVMESVRLHVDMDTSPTAAKP